MEIKYANRPGWQRLLQSDFHSSFKVEPDFVGWVSVLRMHSVREPLQTTYGVCIVDDGYLWLQHFPEGEHYVVTTMVDGAGAIVQWYVDICLTHGVTEAGIPWYQDLYLDLVFLPSGEALFLDEDELERALADGHIDTGAYRLACKTADQLFSQHRSGGLSILAVC